LQRDGFVKRFKLLLQSQTELLDLLENDLPNSQMRDLKRNSLKRSRR